MSSIDEMKKILSARLREVFHGEPQETTARKLSTTQGNISKWVRETNPQTPTTDSLYEIAKAYNVSVDWLFGLSPQKEVDGVVLEKLTYEQITRIIDYLIQHKNIEIPNLSEINAPEPEYEEDENGDPIPIKPAPIFDPEYLKVTDRALAYLVRRRYKVEDAGMLELWKKNNLSNFINVPLLDYNSTIDEAFAVHRLAGFDDSAWIDRINEFFGKSIEELREIIDEKKLHGDKENG